MLHLDPWIEFVKNKILKQEDLNRDETNLKHTIIYTFCFELSLMIRGALKTYLKHCNVRKDRLNILDMKNEYLFGTMLVTDSKKNYASTIEFKEGKPMGDKLDVKGLPITKSSTNRNASRIFKDILEHKILKSDKIRVKEILLELKKFENEIRQSLRAGDDTYLKPISVKDIAAYDDPLSEAGIRGMLIWNELNPDKAIDLPNDYFLVKLKIQKPSILEKVDDPFVVETLTRIVFEHDDKRIRSKGVYIMAIPRDEKIPRWCVPFIDEDTIVMDTMNSFVPVLNSLGVQNVYTSAKDSMISNYVKI